MDDNSEKFKDIKQILADEKSRETYDALIKVKTGENIYALKNLMVFPQYFPKDIIKENCFDPNGCFVDGGGYSGDTVLEFIKRSHKIYKAIYTWEPDNNNLKYLRRNIKGLRDVVVVEKGMWDKATTLTFDSNGNDKSRVKSDGHVKISVDSVDNVCVDIKVSFIKMDIEGAEQQALEGCKRVINRDRPTLAICIYHTYEDLWKIPKWIEENTKNYSVYIRAHSDTGYEVVAYGIPKERI